jgi:hypothetical protein
MNTQQTQKKRLTIKVAKADVPEPNPEAGVDMASAAPVRGASSAYHKPAAIMAILASLVVAVLITLQLMEWAYFKAPPTVWAPKIMVPGTVR